MRKSGSGTLYVKEIYWTIIWIFSFRRLNVYQVKLIILMYIEFIDA